MVPAPGSMVLVVEDDESMREAIKRLLNAAGVECAAYASAESMLASGHGEGAACVVSDLKLPRDVRSRSAGRAARAGGLSAFHP